MYKPVLDPDLDRWTAGDPDLDLDRDFDLSPAPELDLDLPDPDPERDLFLELICDGEADPECFEPDLDLERDFLFVWSLSDEGLWGASYEELDWLIDFSGETSTVKELESAGDGDLELFVDVLPFIVGDCGLELCGLTGEADKLLDFLELFESCELERDLCIPVETIPSSTFWSGLFKTAGSRAYTIISILYYLSQEQ